MKKIFFENSNKLLEWWIVKAVIYRINLIEEGRKNRYWWDYWTQWNH